MAKSVEFRDDDPTVWLWRKLLRRKPEGMTKPRRTREQQKELARKLRTYYVEHQHPRQRKTP